MWQTQHYVREIQGSARSHQERFGSWRENKYSSPFPWATEEVDNTIKYQAVHDD